MKLPPRSRKRSSWANDVASSLSRPNLQVPSASSLTRSPLFPSLTVLIASLLDGSARASWRDRPDVRYDVLLDDVEHVVEVYGSRAVSGDHLGAISEIERRNPIEVDEAVLLGARANPPLGETEQSRHGEVDADRLP